MTKQRELAQRFHALHVKGEPLVLFNIWDAGSARIVAQAGAKAIATASWSIAAANGYEDGEAVPLQVAIANLRRIAAVVDLPVTIDLEGGYARASSVVGGSVARALDAGAIGFNLEDQIIGEDGLYSSPEQSVRIGAARAAVDSADIPAFINARTDLFLKTEPARHDEAIVDSALARAYAYHGAGASGFFTPGLIDERLIARLCERSPLPVNIMIMAGAPPIRRLAELGVARISHGPGPYRIAMRALEDAARAAYRGG
ncbi:isocitrate lyase/phosphoenolpyruvate mutase family protein [soil metagenome]